ncbi:FAD-dependent oxidoreductase [Micromonospora echinaurantiaca]|uniref:FAD-dependent oxidoreductase n=1 Tax=Micromonospora TaxID=1873 RepID=UPI0018EE7266|nr:FAD-dependent oxidoreductase [Micromonospora sp. S4605]
MHGEVDALVIGAGVSGLSTAICLQEAGLRVLVRATQPPERSTSMMASAMIGPSFAAPGDPALGWHRETVRRLTPDTPGVRVLDGRMAARPAGMVPPGVERFEGYRPCRPEELPEGYGTAFWVRQPVVDMPPYLRHLADRFTAAGGRLVLEPVRSLDEAAEVAPLVANCAGLGAAELTGDRQLKPVRGPKIVVANPGIEHFFIEAPLGPIWAGFIPHGDRVVLGGTHRDSADTTPDEAEAAEIIRRCAVVEPRLADAPVLEHSVGLRPGRPAPRLELEKLGRARIVHNYGHAGTGVMLSWGCAKEAADLLVS